MLTACSNNSPVPFAPHCLPSENVHLAAQMLRTFECSHWQLHLHVTVVGAAHRASTSSFFWFMPALLQEGKETVELLSYYPGFLSCVLQVAELVGATH